MSDRRAGLPITIKMRHDAHYVEDMISRTGAAIGKMIAIEQIQRNADQPRRDLGDLQGLIESVRDKGVLEPLLVRYLPEAGKYLIVAGERRYLAACEAGLKEVPCIEKDVDDAETMELALIENLLRKDLTPFEEADGVYALGEQFHMTHEEIAHRIGKSRSSVSEVLSLRTIPDDIKGLCIENAVMSKSQLLQVVRQPNLAKMRELVHRFRAGMVNREQAREERHPERARNSHFRFVSPTRDFTLTLQFRKSDVGPQEVIQALKRVIEQLESQESEARSPH